MKLFLFLWYFTVFCLYMAGILHDRSEAMHKKMEENGTPYKNHFGGRYKYLTYLDMVSK